MRAILILNILILVLGLGYGFRVNDVLDALGGVVQETQRQSDVNDNIPAVFAATLGASLIANAVLNKPPDTLNKIDCRCGVEKSSRIVNGAAVSVVNKYPWMVALIYSGLFVENLTGSPNYVGQEDNALRELAFCGGSLVSSKHVVTAAHCLFRTSGNTDPMVESDILIRIGDHNLADLTETQIAQNTIKVSKITVHPEFEVVLNPWTGQPMPPFLDNDIAILELEEEVDLMEYTPICLAGTDVKESGVGTVAGWGSTGVDPANNFVDTAGNPFCFATSANYPDILQETTMRMCTDDEAAAFPVGSNQICAVGTDTSAYSGDSGGPISLKSGDQHVQVGDVSFGPRCIVSGFTGDVTAVFGRISHFRTWLEGEMKEATVCKNGFDADAALPRNLNPRNWGRQKRPAVHTRLNLGNKKRNKNKNKKGKKNKKE